MARLILGVTGSVAAIRTPALFANLSAAGHAVRVLATEPASTSSIPPSSSEVMAIRRRIPLLVLCFVTSMNGRHRAILAVTRSCTSNSATGPTF